MRFTKETARRALRTFLQAFVSYIAVNIVAINFYEEDIEVLKSGLIGLAISALAAGIAAVMNLEREEISDDELASLMSIYEVGDDKEDNE